MSSIFYIFLKMKDVTEATPLSMKHIKLDLLSLYIQLLQTCMILSAAPFAPEQFLNPSEIFTAFCL